MYICIHADCIYAYMYTCIYTCLHWYDVHHHWGEPRWGPDGKTFLSGPERARHTGHLALRDIMLVFHSKPRFREVCCGFCLVFSHFEPSHINSNHIKPAQIHIWSCVCNILLYTRFYNIALYIKVNIDVFIRYREWIVIDL